MFRNLIESAQSRLPFDSKRIRNSLNNANRHRRIERHDDESVWCVEPLERRQMLAGDISAALTNGGTLRITGSGDSNQIIVTNDGAGHVTVEGKSGTGTTVNGGFSSVTFLDTSLNSIPQDLVINMGGGDDYVEIDDVVIERDVRINMAAGDDTVGVFDTDVLQDVVMRLGSGDDLVGFSRLSIADDLRIVAAAGMDAVGMSECFEVFDRAVFNMGSGIDVLFMQGEFLGTTRVSMGAGEDLAVGNHMTVDDDLKIQMGGSNDLIVVGSNWLTAIGATISVNGGAGQDELGSHPSGPTISMRSIESSGTTTVADTFIDSLGSSLQTIYFIRGGDVTDLGCP